MIRTPPLRAFRATRYEAAGAVARIGRRSAALDALLARHGVRQAGFITAWNPLSRPMPPGWNRRMQARLRQMVRGDVLAEGFGQAGRWAEHHLLVAGDPRRLAVLARRFRQWAIVTVAPRYPARLRLVVQPRLRLVVQPRLRLVVQPRLRLIVQPRLRLVVQPRLRLVVQPRLRLVVQPRLRLVVQPPRVG